MPCSAAVAKHRKRELLARILITDQWPQDTTEAAVKAQYPTALTIGLRMDGGRFTGQAAAYFATAETKVAAEIRALGCRSLSAKTSGVRLFCVLPSNVPKN